VTLISDIYLNVYVCLCVVISRQIIRAPNIFTVQAHHRQIETAAHLIFVVLKNMRFRIMHLIIVRLLHPLKILGYFFFNPNAEFRLLYQFIGLFVILSPVAE